MKGFLTVLITVLIISSCNTDDSEPTVPICTEGTINVVHTQIDTIQDYTLADEFMEGVYRINSDEEFAAFFNEVPPAINYDSLTLLVAVVDAGDYTFTESIQTSFDCEAQMLKLDHSLYNYEENIDTLKYWRHVVLSNSFSTNKIHFDLRSAACDTDFQLDYHRLGFGQSIVIYDNLFVVNNILTLFTLPICNSGSDSVLSTIANNELALTSFGSEFNQVYCVDVNFSDFSDFSTGSLVVAYFSAAPCFYRPDQVQVNCHDRKLQVELSPTSGCTLEPTPQALILPLDDHVSSELNIELIIDL